MTYGEVSAEITLEARECPSCLAKVSIGPIQIEGTMWHCKATCSYCEKRFLVTGRLLAVGVEEI